MNGPAISAPHLALRFPSNPSSVGEARLAVARFASEAGFDSAAVSDITLAAGEACNDAVECGERGSDFSLDCQLMGGVLRIGVEYQGIRPMEQMEEPPVAGGLRPQDLGALLMRRLMDSTERQSEGNGCTRVILERALGSAR